MSEDDRSGRLSAVLLDIDGTLLDSNEAHVRAWVEALGRHGHPIGAERIRPLIGKGGDKVLAELLGLDEETPLAQRINDERRRFFLDELLPSLAPTRGARELLARMKAEGLARIVATSASGAELQALLRQAGIEDLIERTATASDAEHSKPDADIVEVALGKSGVAPAAALMLGDTPYDVAAARAAGVASIALRCGGFWDDAALAGAVAIYDDPAALLAGWADSPLAAAARKPAARA